MGSARSIHHLTLSTGHSRRSQRDEVPADVVALLRPLLDRALAGESVLLPGPPGVALYLTAESGGRWLLAGVHGEGMLLATVAVATTALSGARLWRHILGEGDDDARPPAPWCAVRLELGLALHSQMGEVAGLLGDCERCLAWTWVEVVEGRTMDGDAR